VVSRIRVLALAVPWMLWACAPEDELVFGTFGIPIINGSDDTSVAHRAVVFL
jgi:hypothetical protein